MRKIRLLIVDDAVVVRQIVSKALAEDPLIEIAGTAATGRIALSKIRHVQPDVITLDVEMPEMSGLETLAALKREHPHIPVIMFGTLTELGAQTTLEALALGASDYVTKPANVGGLAETLRCVREDLLPRIKALCAKAVGLAPDVPAPAPRPAQAPAPSPLLNQESAAGARRIDLLAIGCSTGGPNALSDLLSTLAPDFPVPIVIVQHMPPIFTQLLAERLDQKSALKVREAQDGDLLEPGLALLAPGNFHMEIRRQGTRPRVVLHQGPQENSCRPAVDVLFRSLGELYGGRTLAVVLTGMGQDGLRGCREVRAAGGGVLVQDEATSVVWGMPGAVAGAGLADRVLPLGALGAEISRRVQEGRAPQARAPLFADRGGAPT